MKLQEHKPAAAQKPVAAPDTPLVSVVIPAYNRVDLTIQTIDSVLAQTYPALEVIVVDDGSTDNTRERLRVYGDRIRYIHKENGGACSARNTGFRAARGKYIGFLDCDDLYEPQKVAVCVEKLEERPEYGFVHTDAVVIDEEDRLVRHKPRSPKNLEGWICKRLVRKNFIYNPTVMIRRECLEAVGGFDEDLFPPADWDMWLRLAERFPAGYIHRPLSKYRAGSNWCFKNVERTRREERLVLDRFFERNPGLRGRVRRAAYIRQHISMAGYFILMNKPEQIWSEFRSAWRRNPFYWKSNAMICAYLFLRPRLIAVIKREYYIQDCTASTA